MAGGPAGIADKLPVAAVDPDAVVADRVDDRAGDGRQVDGPSQPVIRVVPAPGV